MKEAGSFIGVFVTLAVLFGLGVRAVSGPRYAGESFAVNITTLLITTVASLVKSRWDDDLLDSQLTSPDQPDRAISTKERA
jgi:hypothetical protein